MNINLIKFKSTDSAIVLASQGMNSFNDIWNYKDNPDATIDPPDEDDDEGN